MRVISKVLGELQVNCYVVENNGEALVIDPGAQADVVLDILKNENVKLTHILLTHGHYDHIGAVTEIKDATGAKICIHKDDADMLSDPVKNLSVYISSRFTTYPADIILNDGDTIDAIGLKIKVIHTPGHTPGGVCFEIGKELFTGDTLFMMSIGRADFPGSSQTALDNSVSNVLGSLEQNYYVYPGHGPATTLDQEKMNNPFLRR